MGGTSHWEHVFDDLYKLKSNPIVYSQQVNGEVPGEVT